MWDAELRNDGAIKVSNRRYIFARVARDVPGGIAWLQSLGLPVEASSDEGGENFSNGRSVLFFEVQDRNHPIEWICEAIVRSAVTNHAGLVDIARWRNHNGGDTAIGGGKLVSIDISEIERAFLSNCQLRIDGQRDEKRTEREKEL